MLKLTQHLVSKGSEVLEYLKVMQINWEAMEVCSWNKFISFTLHTFSITCLSCAIFVDCQAQSQLDLYLVLHYPLFDSYAKLHFSRSQRDTLDFMCHHLKLVGFSVVQVFGEPISRNLRTNYERKGRTNCKRWTKILKKDEPILCNWMSRPMEREKLVSVGESDFFFSNQDPISIFSFHLFQQFLWNSLWTEFFCFGLFDLFIFTLKLRKNVGAIEMYITWLGSQVICCWMFNTYAKYSKILCVVNTNLFIRHSQIN